MAQRCCSRARSTRSPLSAPRSHFFAAPATSWTATPVQLCRWFEIPRVPHRGGDGAMGALGPYNACNTRMLHTMQPKTARHQRERIRGAPAVRLRLLQRSALGLPSRPVPAPEPFTQRVDVILLEQPADERLDVHAWGLLRHGDIHLRSPTSKVPHFSDANLVNSSSVSRQPSDGGKCASLLRRPQVRLGERHDRGGLRAHGMASRPSGLQRLLNKPRWPASRR